MNPINSRREVLISLTSVAAMLAGAAARAADKAGPLPRLKPTEPLAMALSYFEDAGKVDAKKFPTYKPGQLCSNCLQLTGKAGDEWRPCNLFPGKLVHANGWCKVYVKKP